MYKNGNRWCTHSFVVFFSENETLNLAFVASKKVGNAVKRAKAKRKLRALCLSFEKKIKSGKYIFVAKEKIFQKDTNELEEDFIYVIKKLESLR